jgi:hypothetical protein
MADEPGGKGGGSALPQTSDTRLIEKAVRQRWNIPEALRTVLPGVMARIVASPEASDRNRIAAARVILTADQLNMSQETRDAGGEVVNVDLRLLPEDQKRERIRDILAAARLRMLGAAPDPGAGGGPGGANGTPEV